MTPLMSYRNASEVLNKVRKQDERNITNARTLCNIIDRQSRLIRENIDSKVENILNMNDVEIKENEVTINKDLEMTETTKISQEDVNLAFERYNSDKADNLKIPKERLESIYEIPDETYLELSVDDVLVKHQKEEGRKKDSLPPEKRSYVKNSIAHIQYGFNTYLLNAASINNVFKIILAFILNSQLYVSNYIVFYADGALDIKAAINKYFSWIKYKLILDWYHLSKKCKQRLSSSINNKTEKEKILNYITSQLWLGKIDEAIIFLQNIDKKIIKSQKAILSRLFFQANTI
jgi:hypothetical protein